MTHNQPPPQQNPEQASPDELYVMMDATLDVFGVPYVDAGFNGHDSTRYTITADQMIRDALHEDTDQPDGTPLSDRFKRITFEVSSDLSHGNDYYDGVIVHATFVRRNDTGNESALGDLNPVSADEPGMQQDMVIKQYFGDFFTEGTTLHSQELNDFPDSTDIDDIDLAMLERRDAAVRILARTEAPDEVGIDSYGTAHPILISELSLIKQALALLQRSDPNLTQRIR